MRIALFHTRVRVEEQLLLDACQSRGIVVEPIDLRRGSFPLWDRACWSRFDLVLDRSLSLTSSLAAVRLAEAAGLRCINRSSTIEACSDKLRTTLALEAAGVPTPRTRLALSPEGALDAIESLGYPAVLKPTVGSWGRLVARVNDRDAAEAIIEHRNTLGSAQQRVFYIQEHIDKPGRDLRVFVIAGEPVAAIARASDHWITNTSRSGVASGVDITPDLARISTAAAACVGGDAVAVDLLECPQRGLLVNEINHSMEFRNSIQTTGVDIPGRLVEALEELCCQGAA